MTQLADECFSTTSLAPSYALMLLSIIKNPAIQPRELCKVMQLTPSTVTRLIEKLESKGLVLRRVKGKHTYVSATDKGNRLEDQIEGAWNDLFLRYRELLGVEKVKVLTDDIFKAYQKLL